MTERSFAPWFFVEHLPPPGETWLLARDEAKHAMGAKRLEPGDAVVLFDGRGSVAEATLGGREARARDGSIPVTVQSVRIVPVEGRRVHLATALPKGDRLSTLVDMTTQLGVASMTPLRCERSVVGETDARADRIRRIQIEACKQARVARLPELRPERTVASFCEASDGAKVVLHPGGTPLAQLAPAFPAEVTLFVGPEGGFTESEVAGLERSGATIASLGASILRIETAAIVGVAMAGVGAVAAAAASHA
jgi:16S rRNA (uracil1498-N3)-methyltransferase